MCAFKTAWNGSEDFFKFVARKDQRVIDIWTRKGDLPFDVRAKPGVHNVMAGHPVDPFIWSMNLSCPTNADDLVFSYGNVQGVLNIIWRMYDKDLQKFRQKLKGKFNDSGKKRWNAFYLSSCWSILSSIMRKIVKKEEVQKSLHRITPSFEPVSNPAIQLAVGELIDAPRQVSMELPKKKLTTIEFSPNHEDLIIVPMNPGDFEGDNADIQEYIKRESKHDVMTRNLLKMRSSKCPTKIKKLRAKIDQMRNHLKHVSVDCTCARCCYRIILASKFSSTLVNHVCNAKSQMADAQPPPNLRNKTIKAIVGSIRTVRNAAERHQEKMYVLCKIGRFAENLGEYDTMLVHRQQRVIYNAYMAFHTFLSTTPVGALVGEPELLGITHSYWRQADKLLDYCNRYVDKINKTTECAKIVKYVKKVQNYLFSVAVALREPFNPDNVHYVEFDDEDEGLAGDIEVLGLQEDLVYGAEPQMSDGAGATPPLKGAAAPDPTKAPAAGKKDTPKGKTSASKKAPGKKSKADGKAVKRDPPKEKAVTKGETNKTLVLADERTVQKQTLKKTKNLKAESNAEKNQQMTNVFERMMFIARYNWDSATSTDDSLDALLLPGAYFSFASQKAEKVCQPLTVNNILCNYGFFRADMKIRIQLNSSKMASGILLIYFEPFCFKERQNYATAQSFTNFPHAWVNVCESTSVEFTIPHCNMREYFPLYWDNHAEYNYWGYLHIRPWNALRGGDSTSVSATISVYMGFENWEVHQQVNPKLPTAITFAQDVIPIDFPGYSLETKVPSPETYFRVARAGDNLELQMEAGIGEVLAAAPEVGAVLMETLAKAMSRLAADAPLANAAPANARLEIANVPAHGDGPKNAKSLSLTSCKQTPMKDKFMDSIAPCSYKDLLKMESYVASFSLKTSHKENDSLFTWCVCPMMTRESMTKTVKLHSYGEQKVAALDNSWATAADNWTTDIVGLSPTMLSYLAMGHLWWRGSLNWRFQAAKTAMHTARLGLRYQPSGGTTGKETECQKISQPSVIWDLQESDELLLTTEYAAPQPFLSTKWYGISGDAGDSSVVGDFACGIAEMFVVNQMKKGTGVSDTVTINLYITAGPDFEFAGTSDLACIAGIGKMPTIKMSNDLIQAGQGFRHRYLEFLWAMCTETSKTHEDITYTPITGGTSIGTYADQKKAVEMLFGFEQEDYVTKYLAKFRKLYGIWLEMAEHMSKRDVICQIPRRTRLTYDAALQFVYKTGLENKWADVVPARNVEPLFRGLAIAHMGHHAVKLPWLPDLTLFPVQYKAGDSVVRLGNAALEDATEVELQMADKEDEGLTCDAPKVKGINPFTDGTNVGLASVKELLGENFNDMYQRLRRQYCVAKWVYPRYRDGTDTWFDTWQTIFARMNPEEFDDMYWEIGIPVTPAQNIGYLGDGNAYPSVGSNKGKFCDSKEALAAIGLNWGNDYTVTPLTWLTEVFTFWRGDLRFSFFFPTDVELHATVVHIPDDYGEAYTSVNSGSAVRRMCNFGNVLYKGNVMGELSVEVPWCAKYSRLVLSRNGNSAITQNGSIRLFVKIKRDNWDRSIAKPPSNLETDAKYLPVDPVKFWLYMSFGETAELLVPRAAPKVFMYKGWYDLVHNDKFIYDNYDEIHAVTLRRPLKHKLFCGVERVIRPTTDGGYEKSLKVSQQCHPVFHTGSLETTHRLTEANLKALRALPEDFIFLYHKEPELQMSDESLITLKRTTLSTIMEEVPLCREDQEAIELKMLEFADEKPELQMDGEETCSEDTMAVTKEVYDAFKRHGDEVDGSTYRLTMNEVIAGGMHTFTSIPVLLEKFNKLMEQTSNTWNIADGTLNALKSAGEKTSNLMGNVIPKAWDAARIGLIGYAIYSFLNAEDWNGKAMALMSGALGMGLNYEIVKRSFDWLLASISSLFAKQEDQETVELQGEDEDDTGGEFARFVLRHASSLKIVASAVGAFAIFSMCPSGVPKMENGVKGFAQSMVGKLRNLTVVGAGFKTFEWLFEWIGKMFKYAFEWACDLVTGGMLTKKALIVAYPKVLDWLTQIERYKNENELTKAAWDYEVQMKIWRLMDKGKEFAESIGKKEQFLANYIAQGSKNLADMHKTTVENNMSVPFRTDPYCIWLYGAPGVGKSAMANGLGDFIGDFVDLPHTNRVYARNEDEEYWSGYIGQPIIMIDDICQNKKGHAVHEFIRMKSNNEVQVPMASLNEKGRKFRSQIIIATSNMGYPVPEDMASAKALWRRRNLLVKVSAGPNGQKGARYCKFNVMHPIQQDVIIKEDISYADLAAYAAQDARDYLLEQWALIGSNLKGRKIPKWSAVEENADAVEERFRDAVFRAGGQIMKREVPTFADLDFLAGMNAANVQECIKKTTQYAMQGFWEIVEPVVMKYREQKYGQAVAVAKAVEEVVKQVEAGAETQMTDEEEFNKLRDTAWDIQDTDERKYIGYKKLLRTKLYPTSWTHVADADEIRKTLQSMYPEDTTDEIERRVNDWQKIFNESNRMDQMDTGESHTPTEFGECLKKADFRNMFIKQGENWQILALPSDANDDQFQAMSVWETVLKDMEMKDRNTLLDKLMKREADQTKLHEPGVTTTLRQWVNTKTQAVLKYFEDHPWIMKTLKLGAMAAGFFLGYRLLRWICKDYTDKIEAKLCEYFGLLKETKYVKYVKDKAVVVKDWTKNTALVKKVTALIAKETGSDAAETEACIEPIVEDALKNGILPSLTSVEKVRKKNTNAYYVGEKPKAVPQGSADSTADSVRNLIVGNFVRIKAFTANQMRSMLGIIVDRNYLLAPLHYFDQMEERTEMTITYLRGNQKETHIEVFSSEKLRQLAKLDAAIYQLGFGFVPKRKITQHFMTLTDLPHVSKTGANLITLTPEDLVIQHVVDAQRRGGLVYKDNCIINYDVENLNIFEYNAGTSKGDCGSLLIARNNGIRKKILGMHVAGLPGRDIGYSVCVPAEVIESTINSFLDDEAIIQLPEESELQEAFPHYVADPEEVIMPKGEFRLQGIIAKSLEVKMPMKTEIRKSPIHGKIREPVTEPAILSVKDPRWTFDGTPLYNAIEKYGKESKPFYYDDLKYVVKDVASDWYSWKLIMQPRVLTDHEAIFGNETIPFCDRMNLTSSAGFPFVKWNSKKGKSWLYDTETFDGIKDGRYREMYLKREDNAKKRKRVPHLWISCLKDERRKKKKILQGKTRAFMIAGADWVQLYRKYFLAFFVNFYANAGQFYSAVGVDPFSMDWTVIFRRITTVGKSGFGIDYENFDGLTDADLMILLTIEVNKWYKVHDPNWTEEDDNVRLTLASDCVHSLVLVGCLMLWKKKGNPSGNPGTAVINTKVNVCYARLALLAVLRMIKLVCKIKQLFLPNELMARLIDTPMKLYRTGVREIAYGDDGVYGVAEWLQSFFNLKTVTDALAMHGIVSTSENKEDEYEVQPLLNCTFLKCGFKPLAGRESFYLAPIAQDTIYELTNWVRKSDDDIAQLRVNLQDALKFAFHWGLPFFRKFSADVNNVLHEHGMMPVVSSYHIERENFLDKCM